jgi:hypothetical protein
VTKGITRCMPHHALSKVLSIKLHLAVRPRNAEVCAPGPGADVAGTTSRRVLRSGSNLIPPGILLRREVGIVHHA